MKLRILPRAAADIRHIVLYIADANPWAAAKVAEAIEKRLKQRADHPYSGVLRDDIGLGIRHLVAGQYLALYRVEADSVDIIRLLHARRSIDPQSTI